MGNRLNSRRCALCGRQVASVVFQRLRGQIERAPAGAGELAVQLGLGLVTDGELPVVVTAPDGGYREHRCPKQPARSFSAANLNRKRRDA